MMARPGDVRFGGARMRKARIAFIALAAWPALARAGAASDIAEGTRLLRKVREEQAIHILTRALDRGDATLPQRAQIYVLLGVARFGLRDEEGARLAFRRALEAKGDVPFPRFGHPKARKLFEAARVEPAATPPRPDPPLLTPEVPPPPPPAIAEIPEPPAPVQLAPAAPIVAPAAVQARPLPRGVSGKTWAGTALAVAGGVAAGVGAWLMLDAQSLRQRAVDEPDAISSDALYRQAVSQDGTGFVLAAASGGAAIIGLIVALWPSDRGDAAVAVTPGGAAFAARF